MMFLIDDEYPKNVQVIENVFWLIWTAQVKSWTQFVIEQRLMSND